MYICNVINENIDIMNDEENLIKLKTLRNQLCFFPEKIQKYKIESLKGGKVDEMLAVQFSAFPDTIVIVALNWDNLYEVWAKKTNENCYYYPDIYKDELWDTIEFCLQGTGEVLRNLPTFQESFGLEVLPKGNMYELCAQANIPMHHYFDGPIIASVDVLLEVIYSNFDVKNIQTIEQTFKKCPANNKLHYLNYLFHNLFY